MVLKHLGLEDLVEVVIDRMGNVHTIALIGDYAKGIDSGSIEVFLIGEKLNFEYISQLEHKIENLIGRKVSFIYHLNPTNQSYISLYNKNNKYELNDNTRPWGKFEILKKEKNLK